MCEFMCTFQLLLTHTYWPLNEPILLCDHLITERKEDPVDIPLLQMETRGHAAIADAFGQEGEGQEDSVRQRQSSSSRQSVLAVARVGALQKICHILQKIRQHYVKQKFQTFF